MATILGTYYSLRLYPVCFVRAYFLVSAATGRNAYTATGDVIVLFIRRYYRVGFIAIDRCGLATAASFYEREKGLVRT